MVTFTAAEELLAKLVSFDTVSDSSNRQLTDFVCDYLARHDVTFSLFHDAAEEKTAVFATVGPMIDGGLILSGHTDVVPVVDQVWGSNPFSLRRDDNRLIGRGTADMKGFCAAALAILPRLKHGDLQVPVHLLLSYDEETTGLGSLGVIREFGKTLPKPSQAIIGEPTEMKVVVAHKGVASYATSVDGVAAHASRPSDGVSAITIAGEAMSLLRSVEQELSRSQAMDHRFDPPQTTVHVGSIRGGSAPNIVPSQCNFEWEVRCTPGTNPEIVRAKLDEWSATVLQSRDMMERGVNVTTRLTSSLPPLATIDDEGLVPLALRVAEQNETHAVPYATEAGHFQGAGISAVVCGPGSIKQAHRPDEYITVDDLRRYDGFLERVCGSLSGKR